MRRNNPWESRSTRQVMVANKAAARAIEVAKIASKLFTSTKTKVSHSSKKNKDTISRQIELPSIEHALKEKARRDFKSFVDQAMPVVEPGVKWLRNWATDAICDHCQAVAEGIRPLDPGAPDREVPIRDLIINVPPRHAKSTIVAVLFPAWVWINYPEKRFIITSYSHRNTLRDSRKCRQLIESVWYQSRWGDSFKLADDSNTLIRYDNNRGGFRYAVSITGQIVGEGADIIIADDLHNLADIHSRKKRERPNQIWDDVMSSRFSDPKTGATICISQRGHGSDHTGHLLEKHKKDKNLVHLRIPAEFEYKYKCETRLPWKDPRTKDGELIDARRFGPEEISKLKVKLGSWNAAAQLQQRPVPVEGGIFENSWWKFWTPATLPPQNTWEDSCISCDMTFGSIKDSASFVVFQAWCQIGSRFYLLDQDRGRWKYTVAKKRLKKFIQKWSGIFAIYVENKALGPAVIEDLEEEGIPGLLPVEPDGDKVKRASAISPMIEAGNVYIPDENMDGFEWVKEDFLPEVNTFPLSPNDDQVDCLSQALRKLRVGQAFGCGSEDDLPSGDSIYESESASRSAWMPLQESTNGMSYANGSGYTNGSGVTNGNANGSNGASAHEYSPNITSISSTIDDDFWRL